MRLQDLFEEFVIEAPDQPGGVPGRNITMSLADLYDMTGKTYPTKPGPNGNPITPPGFFDKKTFKVGDKISCVITEIDKEKRRIAISHKLTIDNPYKVLNSKNPVGSIVKGTISSSNDYAIYVKLEGYDIDAFLHCNDLSYTKDPDL